MLDLSVLHDALNRGRLADVGQTMSAWHPAILGELLRAIAFAKERRYPGHHRDYDEGLEAAQLAASKRK